MTGSNTETVKGQKGPLQRFFFDYEWPVAVFLLLILVRPIVDITWDWKHSFGISPLQLIGLALPLFIVWALWRVRSECRETASQFWEVLAWLCLLCVAGAATFLVDPSAAAVGVAVKYILPALMIFFGAMYLRDADVLLRIAQALVIAAIVPALFLIYEIIFGPMGTSVRGGVPRFTGPYAQVSVYGIHFSMALLGAGYWYVRRRDRTSHLSLLTLAVLLALFSPWLVHVTTWAVFLSLFVLILLFMSLAREWKRVSIILASVIVVSVAAFSLRSGQSYEWIFIPDVEVVEGEAPMTNFGNSRGYIWKNIWNDFEALPAYAKLLGSSLSGTNYYGAIAFGAHNDFLRILMATGILGLLLYLVWLARTFMAVFRLRGDLRFLGLGALVILLGYSVALTATFIVPLVTVVLPVLGGLRQRKQING